MLLIVFNKCILLGSASGFLSAYRFLELRCLESASSNADASPLPGQVFAPGVFFCLDNDGMMVFFFLKIPVRVLVLLGQPSL